MDDRGSDNGEGEQEETRPSANDMEQPVDSSQLEEGQTQANGAASDEEEMEMPAPSSQEPSQASSFFLTQPHAQSQMSEGPEEEEASRQSIAQQEFEGRLQVNPSLPLDTSQEVDQSAQLEEDNASVEDDTSRVSYAMPSHPIEASMAIDDERSNMSYRSHQSSPRMAAPPFVRRPFRFATLDQVLDENSRGSNVINESSRTSIGSYVSQKRTRFGDADDVSETGSPARRAHTDTHQGSSLIWGTQVDAVVVKQEFRNFLYDFQKNDEGDGHYIQVLDTIYHTKEYNLNINCGDHLFNHRSGKLYKLLIRFPTEMIPLMDLVVHEEYTDRHPEDNLDAMGIRIQVRLYNLRERKKMRDLNPENIDQLVSIEGMIIRCSPVTPDMKLGFFRCRSCNHEVEVPLERNRIEEPSKCVHCGTRFSYRLVHNRCLFADKQTIKIQETPDNVSEGETPHTCTVIAHDSLVDVCKPGDRVTLTGIFRAAGVRVDPRKRTVQAVYKTHLDVLHVRRKQQGKLRDTVALEDAGSREVHRAFHETDLVMSETDREENETKFREMAKSPTLYEDLAQSLAPSIYELLDVKKGLLLQMLGGTNTRSFDSEAADTLVGQKATRTRGEVNILLCGDPGTSKSQMLGYVHRVAPRGIYTSGKGSSAVGLTAYVTKDPDSKELVLESGALVLSDRGVCCIDEFDKMNDATRAILHEVMEQQTISLAKAGIICTLNARTSILASANPVGSRYDPRMSVVENLKLPPTLLSRFDLIYLILDKSDVESDRKLARHLVRLYRPKVTAASDADNIAKYDLETLSKYIAFAKETCRPRISDRAMRKLVDAYVEMRRLGTLGGGGKKTIVATPRQLESFVRLAEAKAKLRLSDEVLPEDVDEAVRLFNVATQKAAMDPRTGTIDMDAINTGIGSVQRLAEQNLTDFLKEYISEKHSRGDVLSRRAFLDVLNSRPNVPQVTLPDLDRAFDTLSRDQVVVMSAGGAVRVA